MAASGEDSPALKPSQPLRILVVGAGIGGLTAALALRRCGHEVHVFEQSRLAQETGAAIHLAPNANGLLKRLGLRPEDHGAVEMNGMREMAPDGSTVFSNSLKEVNKMWQHPWHLIHRAHLHSAIKDLATRADGTGRAVKLHVSSGVEQVDSGSGMITLRDGSQHSGDLVIGADGVHSATRKVVLGGNLKPYDSGKSAFRFLIPRESLAADPRTEPYVTPDDYLTMCIGNDRRVVLYPCVNKTMINLVCIHPSSETAAEPQTLDWQETGSKAKLLEVFAGFHPSITAILEKADPHEVKIWNLLTMDKMPSFTQGRLALIGDASHPFLPDLGQGGAQAIEDAVSLAALLPLGTMPEAISDRLRVYESCRYERSHTIQHYTKLAGRDRDKIGPKDEKVDMHKYTAYNFGHDEWDASTLALQKHLAVKAPETRYRAPYGFGAAPGPRQPLGLSTSHIEIQALRKSCPERFTTYAIRFASSRTLLQALLPPGFAFTSPATVVRASVECTTLDGMTWLSGGGYNLVRLSLHGINYTKKDGSKVFGSYTPVLFEDLPDPIITGREDVGFPKLYATIDVQHESPDNIAIALKWRGTEFGRLQIDDLTEEQEPATNGHSEPDTSRPGPPAPPPEQGTLVYRYVPAVGEPGKADAEYAVLCPYPVVPAPDQAPKKRVSGKASIQFNCCARRSLPTLHHVVERLANIPVYRIEKAEEIKGVGVDDLSGAVRIE